jgi:hypothetical protein
VGTESEVSTAASTSMVEGEGVGAPIDTSSSFGGTSSVIRISSAGGVGVCFGGVIEMASDVWD